MRDLLELAEVRAGYGSAAVLHGVSLSVERGTIAVLLGANGAGKTTTLRAIAGIVRPWSGTIALDGASVVGRAPEQIVRAGLGFVPGPPGVFRPLSVEDNLRVGASALADRGREASQRDWVLDVFPVLRSRLGQRAGSLSGGEQRMLAIARALMGDPGFLLVDEPSMGLSPAMVGTVLRLLASIGREGVTILMAEQNVAALSIASRAFVMEKGVVARATDAAGVETLRRDVARAYLGGSGLSVVGGGGR